MDIPESERNKTEQTQNAAGDEAVQQGFLSRRQQLSPAAAVPHKLQSGEGTWDCEEVCCHRPQREGGLKARRYCI